MHFNKQTAKYSGKVRDVYTIDNTHVVMHASDRISAFDVILPKPIPYKGQVLNQIAEHFLHATADIVPNWLLAVPHPSVSIGLLCKPLPIEVVVRGYLAGHAWRTYKTGERVLCGVTLPDGLKENDPLPQPIITPTTKAHEGHDMDISREEILKQGLVAPNLYAQVEEVALRLFARGSQMAKEKGLILVDTKYEFGMYNGTLYLIDEVHTPDSSRYFYATGYQQRQANGEPQTQLSKEFVRQWLIENNFQGLDGQTVPAMTPEKVKEISERYIQLFQEITGKTFVPQTKEPEEAVIEKALEQIN